MHAEQACSYATTPPRGQPRIIFPDIWWLNHERWSAGIWQKDTWKLVVKCWRVTARMLWLNDSNLNLNLCSFHRVPCNCPRMWRCFNGLVRPSSNHRPLWKGSNDHCGMRPWQFSHPGSKRKGFDPWPLFRRPKNLKVVNYFRFDGVALKGFCGWIIVRSHWSKAALWLWFFKKKKKTKSASRRPVSGSSVKTVTRVAMTTWQLFSYSRLELGNQKKNQDSPSSEAGLCFYMLHNWKTEEGKTNWGHPGSIPSSIFQVFKLLDVK